MVSVAALKRLFLLLLLMGVSVTALAEKPGMEEPRLAAEPVYGRAFIANLGFEKVSALKTQPGVLWWVELDQQLLLLAQKSTLKKMASLTEVTLLDVPVDTQSLVFVGAGHGDLASNRDGDLLAWGGRFAVMQMHPGRPADAVFEHPDGSNESHSCHAIVQPFEPNVVLARSSANHDGFQGYKFSPEVADLLEAVDADRWMADVEHLSGFSRVTGSSGVQQAGIWLYNELSKLPGMTVTFPEFTANGLTAHNVIATLPGRETPDDIYIVGAHYDSIAFRGNNAPGAEDNGSGTAAVLELARIFSVHRPKATVLFICFSGEEQGLYGSANHVNSLVASGLADNVKAVLNMDMISYTSNSDLDLLLETGEAGLFMLALWDQAATEYTRLRILVSTHASGSDHVPYLNNNIPALLTIQGEWASYPGYHRSTDTPEKLSKEMAAEVMKMNVAALAALAGLADSGEPNLILAQ